MKKMVRAVLFAMMAVFSTAVFAEDEDPCAMPANLTEIEGVYQIGTCGDLYKFAAMVNGGETGINGRLTADIDLNGSYSKQWTPIGTYEKPYKGTFDGKDAEENAHVIRRLYFNDENADGVGLFGIIDYDAKVQNVGVVNSFIRGACTVGGVVGHNAGGTISNVYNTGVVSGIRDGRVGGVVGDNSGTVSNVYNMGSVNGDVYVGGVVGYNNKGTVSNSYNTGAVSGNSYVVGGVVGYNLSGTVSNVYNTGAVSGEDGVGGVVGWNIDGTVSNVYNTGAVSGDDRGDNRVGDVVGDNGGIVSNAYYNTDMRCEHCRNPIEGTTGKTTAELAALDVALAFENSDGVWVAGYDSISNGWRKYAFPSLKGVGTAPTFIELDPNATEVEISNVEELLKFAELVNAGNTTLNAKLTADICLNACGEGESVLKADGTLNGDGSNFTQWIPIGTVEKPYEGTFDGNGKRISGLYFSDEDVNYVGLFKYNEGIVQNVGVVDSYIRGRYYVGGVVGCNKGTVSNVYNTGAVSGSDEVGGVVGCNKRTISNVYNTGAVSGWVEVGGVVGFNAGNSTVSNVYNTGAVSGNVKVGGVVGWNIDGTVSNVYNTGAVSGLDEVGGVVGNNGGTVENAYYNTDFYAGNALGENKSGSIENVDGITTAELIAIDIGPDWVAGNLAYDKTTGKLAFGFPYLKNFGNSQYKITALEFKVVDNVIQIANADDLKDFARLVSEFGVTDVNAKLTADICLNACGEGESVLKADGTLNGDGSNFTQWTPIGTAEKPYTGTFDGAGHVISGLYFNDENVNYAGLFGYIGIGAKIQNVGVVDSYILGKNYVGGVVGHNVGVISNVYNTGAVSGGDNVGGVAGGVENKGSVSNVYNTGAVSGGDNVGGVVGNNGGTVSNVYNTGTVSGKSYVGGVVGNNDGTVSNVYNTGALSGEDGVGGVVGKNQSSSISNVYNTGAVSGVWEVGGVVGWNMGGTVSNVYNTGAVSGEDRVGGVVGWIFFDGIVENAYYNTDSYTGSAVGTCAGECEYENVEGKTTAELAGTTLPAGFSGEIWNAGPGEPVVRNGKLLLELPGLKDVGTQPEIEYTGFQPNADGYYEISNALELKCFAQLVNSGATSINGRLTADICLNVCGEGESVLKADGTLNGDGSNFTQWTPIGTAKKTYTGTFDGKDAEGNAHIISGLYFNDETADSVGLFGSIGENAQVQNVGVEDSYFRGGDYVGSVVGFCESGEVDNVYNTGIVEGGNYVGGVAGYIDAGVVSNAYNTGSVSVTGNYVGGVVGGVDNKGSVSNVYNLGSVGGARFAIGGVVGFDYSVTISNAYFNTDFFTGNALGSGEDVENVGGKTSAELAAGTDVVLDADFWVVGAVSENVKQDTLYYPYLKVFGPHEYVLSDVKKYSITVAVNDKAMGSVTGAGEYEYGTTVKLSATANEGYKFTDWEDDVKTAARTITVTKAETYTANFEAIPSSSSSAKSSSSSAKSSSSEAKSSSSEAKSSSSQKESIIAQAQLPQFSVTASGKMVSIAGARPNSVVNVFDMQGNMVKTVVATSANFTFALPSAGVYIVKNGYTAKRVNVR